MEDDRSTALASLINKDSNSYDIVKGSHCAVKYISKQFSLDSEENCQHEITFIDPADVVSVFSALYRALMIGGQACLDDVVNFIGFGDNMTLFSRSAMLFFLSGRRGSVGCYLFGSLCD